MAYPATITTFTDPSGTSPLATGPDHAALHTAVNDTLEVLQNILGTTNSTALFTSYAVTDKPLAIRSGTLQSTIARGTFNTSVFNTVDLTNGTLNAARFTGGTIDASVISGTANFSAGTMTGLLQGTISSSVGTLNTMTMGSPTITGGTANALTLGTPTIQAWDGWIDANETWSALGTAPQEGTITVAASSKYAIGDKLSFTQGGTAMQGYIIGTPSGTTILFTGGNQYVLGTTAITNNRYSHDANPVGFPHVFNYTVTHGGYLGDPVASASYFSLQGRYAHQHYTASLNGTSNANSMTMSLFAKPAYTQRVHAIGRAVDGGTIVTLGAPMVLLTQNTGIGTFYKDPTEGTWVASGGKSMNIDLEWYI